MQAAADPVKATQDDKQQHRNEHWSSVAGAYHANWQNAHADGQLYKELEARRLLELSGAAAGSRVLDVCCGTGRNSLALARHGVLVTGVDAAEGMLRQAMENARAEGLENVRFQNGDVRALPFADDAFDAVVGTRFMYMMDAEEKRRVIHECRRVVRPGGFVVLQFNGAAWGLKHELINFCRGRGFRMEDRYLWPGTARRLFAGMKIRAVSGIKLPRLALVSRLVGRRGALALNGLAEWFPCRHFCGYLLVAAQKCE